MKPLIQLKQTTPVFLVALGLACFAVSTSVQAVNPPPDGGYFGANTAEGGAGALFSLTTGSNNTALGSQALFSLTTGNQNTATGAQALKNNTGDSNTADGFQALVKSTTGEFNVATGWRALFSNTTGYQNTANGYKALYHNTTGGANTATGGNALLSNTTSGGNTADGVGALSANIDGNWNTATGAGALSANTSSFLNTAYGFNALFAGTTGAFNTAIGSFALENNTSSGNIALGVSAGANLTTGDNNIDIGNEGVAAESGTIRIGDAQTATFIAGISGQTASGGVAVYVNSDGKLGTLPSSARFKEDIHSMDNTSDVLLALRPVTFRYKPEIDPKGIPQFGLVAEEVEKINPNLVARDEQGKVYSVRYEAVNAMLLNEFLKEHRKVQEQQATITQLQKSMETVVARLKEQAAQIQKVSAQLEASKPAPQMAINDQ